MTTATPPATTSTKPVKVFRDRRLSVSIFRNHVTVREQPRTFHSVSIQRTYKDGDVFKSTHSLDKDDVPAIQLLLAQAWGWMVNEETALRKKVAV